MVTRSRPETFMTVLPVPPNRPHSQKIAFGSVGLMDNTSSPAFTCKGEICQDMSDKLPTYAGTGRASKAVFQAHRFGIEDPLRYPRARTIKIRGLEEWRHLDDPHFLADVSRQHSRAYPSGQVISA